MKIFVPIIVFLFFSSISVAQKTNRPLDFEDIDPIWQYLMEDISTPDTANINYVVGPIPQLTNPKDHDLFVVWATHKRPMEGSLGAIFDRIDLTTGRRLWQNRIGSNDTSFQEIAASIYLDDQTMEVISRKDTGQSPPIIGIPSAFQPASSKFDIASGALVNKKYKNPKALIPGKTAFNFNRNRGCFKSDDHYYVIQLTDIIYDKGYSPINGILYTMDDNFNYLNADTLLFHLDSPKVRSSPSAFYKYLNDTLVFLFAQNAQPFDKPRKQELLDDLTVDIYKYDLKTKTYAKKDITNMIPYHWFFNIAEVNDDIIKINCIDSIENRKIAHVYLDAKTLELRELIDFERMPERKTNIFSASLPNESGTLIVKNDGVLTHNQDTSKSITFLRTKGAGDIQTIRTIHFNSKRVFELRNLQVTKNNTVLVYYKLSKFSVSKGGSYDVQHGIIAIDGTKELGLVNATEDIHPDVHFSMSVSPNPATDQVVIDFRNNVSGHLSLTDEKGQILMNKKLASETQVQIKTTDLSSGIYLLHFTTDKGHTTTQKLVIKR